MRPRNLFVAPVLALCAVHAWAQEVASASQLALAKTERGRLEALYSRQSIPEQRLDQAVTAEEVSAAQRIAASKAASAALARRAVSEAKLVSARTVLETARLQRSYCEIFAPADGVVSKKHAEVGQVVAPGQPLCAIVPLAVRALWVEANFKETQLRRVRVGHRAEVRADVDPSRVFTGRVESIAAGTGAAFSPLNPIFQQRLTELGHGVFTYSGLDPTTTQQMAQGLIYGEVQRQAALLAFVDVFFALTVVFALLTPFILLLWARGNSAGAGR